MSTNLYGLPTQNFAANLLCYMGEKHRGRHVQRVMRELGTTQKALAKKLNKHPDTIRRWWQEEHLDFSRIKDIGDALGYDFSADFEDYPYRELHSDVLNDPEASYTSAQEWRAKFIDLQDKYVRLLEEHAELLKSLGRGDKGDKDDK